jgi:cell wall-associated NlpC family hydrolase
VGSTGPDVVAVQRLLGVAADGVFGPRTLQAVRGFQARHGLAVDGLVGPRTWSALRDREAVRSAAAATATLVLGDRGPAVARVQRLLGVAADGDFGPVTLAAVKRFQRESGLQVDGQVGPLTQAALRRQDVGRPGQRSLVLGDRGPAVARVQRLLGVAADGDFGPVTLAAVRRFQRTHGLVVDGQVGPFTLAALLYARPVTVARRSPAHPQHRRHRRRHAPAPVAAASGFGERVVELARRELGVRYTWGGNTPAEGFDCSGLVEYVFGELGVSLPHFAASQYGYGTHVARGDLEPGDLVFFNDLGHVAIYIGDGQVIAAPHTGTVVQIQPLDWAGAYVGATRIR